MKEASVMSFIHFASWVRTKMGPFFRVSLKECSTSLVNTLKFLQDVDTTKGKWCISTAHRRRSMDFFRDVCLVRNVI